MKKVSIIIPAYNEEKRIGPTLESYSNYFNSLLKDDIDYKIIVVINNTTDNTEKIVRGFSRKNKRISYLNLIKGGKGYAVISGFKEALKHNQDLIGFVDADMATSPEAFHSLIKSIGGADGVIASRYVPGAVVNPRPSFKRIIVSRLFNILIRALFLMPYRDTQCGAKLFKSHSIKNSVQSLTMSNWAFDVDLIYTLRKKGYFIKEVPTVWADKMYSKIDFLKAGPKMALGIIRLRILNSPLKGFIKIYDYFTRK